MRIILLFILVSITSLGKTQVNATSWGIEDTSLYIIKNTSFGVVHDYLSLYNYSGGELYMRWIRYTPSDWPVGWDCDFSDPSTTYPDVFAVDSGDFVLSDPPGFGGILIIGVDHNSIADTSYQSFKVFPINDPTDTLWVTYHILIGYPWSGTYDESQKDIIVYPNPAQNVLYISSVQSEQYQVSDASGKIVQSGTLESEGRIDISSLSRGIYLIEIDNTSRIRFVKQ